ncbi:MAG: hypothetical protein DRP73_05380, partial [Candidatus Omnitrophota bacterium]
MRIFIIGFLVSFVFQFPVRGNVTFRRVRAYRVRTILERVEGNLYIDASTVSEIETASSDLAATVVPAVVSFMGYERRIKLPETAVPESILDNLL